MIFRYQKNGRTEKRDRQWRHKCSRCRLMDPVSSYGVAPEFLRGVKSSGLGVNRKTRRRSGSKGSRKSSGSPASLSLMQVIPLQQTTSFESVATADPSDAGDAPPMEERSSSAAPPNDASTVEGHQSPQTFVEATSKSPELVPPVVDGNSLAQAPLSRFLTPGKGANMEVPSFLKRVSVPLGEDLLTILNAAATSPVTVGLDGVIIDSSLDNAATGNTESIAISEDNVAEDSRDINSSKAGMFSPEDGLVPSSQPVRAELAAPSIELAVPEVSTVNPIIATRCAGCDACRGRVCRPRLAVDFYTAACTMRFVPTVYSLPGAPKPLTTISRRRSRSDVASAGIIEKSPMIFWHENIRFAVPFKRTIRLFTMLASAISPKVTYISCQLLSLLTNIFRI